MVLKSDSPAVLWTRETNFSEESRGAGRCGTGKACAGLSAARAARRAWNSLIVSDGNGADLQFWTIFSDGGKDRGPLGAVGYSIGRILDVASHEDMAFRGENGGANLEMGERRVSILHDFARRTEQAFAHGS